MSVRVFVCVCVCVCVCVTVNELAFTHRRGVLGMNPLQIQQAYMLYFSVWAFSILVLNHILVLILSLRTHFHNPRTNSSG